MRLIREFPDNYTRTVVNKYKNTLTVSAQKTEKIKKKQI
jgi:hypothetical protein